MCRYQIWDIIGKSAETYRVSNLEARAGLESLDDLSVEASGIEGERQLLRDVQQLQLHRRANFLLRIKAQITCNSVSCMT